MKISRSGRMKTSIWHDRVLWRELVAWCKQNHLSTCLVEETLNYAFLKAVKAVDVQPSLVPIPKIEMTVHVSREVQRSRRRERVRDGPVFEDWGSVVKCCVCHRPSRWVVYYAPGWDKTLRVYCCGYHVKRYRRMASRGKGYPQIRFQQLYK